MNVLADFAKNKSRLRWIYITFLQYIWRRKRFYIYFVFFEIFYIGFAFVHCAGWGSFAWFSGGAIRPRVCGDGAFTGDFLAGELCEIFVFFAVVVTNFCIFIMLVICLFINYYYYYYYYYFGWRHLNTFVFADLSYFNLSLLEIKNCITLH